MSASPALVAPPADRPKGGADALIAAISAQLEEDIVLARLHPRERLIEQDLADRFGTHRAVIRQVLYLLDGKGLIERVPNRGAIVRDLTPQEVEHIYAVREELEVMAGRILPLPVAARELARLRDLQAIHDRAVDAGDLRTVFHSNLEFHRAMFDLCGNACLIQTIDLLARKVHAIRSYSHSHPEYLQQVRQDHHAMLDALRRSDRDELMRLLRKHLQPSKRAYITAYRRRFGEQTSGKP